MTEEQKTAERKIQRLVYVDDERWEKVERRKFNMRAKGDKTATNSSIVSTALDKFFEGDKS